MTSLTARGFSLLETLVYVALFALIMQGAFAGIFAISESADRNEARAYLTEEGDFIADKISYEISNATAASFPFSNATNTEIDLASASGDAISIALSDQQFFIALDEGSPTPFSSNRVAVSDVAFTTGSNVSRTAPIDFSFILQTTSAGGQELSEDFIRTSYLGL